MGAWGVGVFENDTASDWIYELEKSSGDSLLRATLSQALEPADYLDADIGSNALAGFQQGDSDVQSSGRFAGAAFLVAEHDDMRRLDSFWDWLDQHAAPHDRQISRY